MISKNIEKEENVILIEQFSPLHIEASLSLIRDEFKSGHEKLAEGLLERLQFPLTLGSFKKSLDIAREYLSRLLAARMLSKKSKDEIEKIAKTLNEEYADHSFCINIKEAKAIGLEVEEIEGQELDIIWDIYKLSREKEKIKTNQKRKDMEELLKNIPPNLLDKELPSLK